MLENLNLGNLNLDSLNNAVSMVFLASIVFNLVMTFGFYFLHKRNSKKQKVVEQKSVA